LEPFYHKAEKSRSGIERMCFSASTPAHAVVLNAAASDGLWPLVETVRQEAPGTPIVGCSVPRIVERAIDTGALGYLIKPVTRTDLERAMQAVDGSVRRVLVVDDDPDVLQLFSRMLHVCDSTLEIATVSSGKQALDELRRTAPDLMLLDVLMPDMDGWQVLEAMSEDERIGEVPTFFVSAQDLADQPPASQFLLATMGGGSRSASCCAVRWRYRRCCWSLRERSI
jgi:CheY-like chemotaxis protein